MKFSFTALPCSLDLRHTLTHTHAGIPIAYCECVEKKKSTHESIHAPNRTNVVRILWCKSRLYVYYYYHTFRNVSIYIQFRSDLYSILYYHYYSYYNNIMFSHSQRPPPFNLPLSSTLNLNITIITIKTLQWNENKVFLWLSTRRDWERWKGKIIWILTRNVY